MFWCFLSCTAKIQDLFLCTQKGFFSNFSQICVTHCFFLNKIIRPPPRLGTSRCWSDSRIIAQVSHRLPTIRGHFKIQFHHRRMSCRRFRESVQLRCWLAGYVHHRCCLWILYSFLCHKPFPKAFWSWNYFQTTSQAQNMCSHTSPGPPHSASSPPSSPQTRQLLQQPVCITKGFLHKLSETLSGKLVYMLKPPTWVASGTLKRCSLHPWILGSTLQGRGQTACMASCGWEVCWCQPYWIE